MNNHKKAWRKSDDTRLYELATAYLDRGEEPDWEEIGKELGRTWRSCSDHWNTLYKKKRQPTVKAINLEKEFNDRLEQDKRLMNKMAELNEIIRAATEEREKIKQILNIREDESK